MQKFVTIYLHDYNVSLKLCESHEHLEEYLADGWKIVEFTPVGIPSPSGYIHYQGTRVWIVVLLEKKTT